MGEPERTAHQLSLWALPIIAAAVALIVSGPVLWWIAPVAAAVAGCWALVVGIPSLWVLRLVGADHTAALTPAGGVLGGVAVWLAPGGWLSTLELLLPPIIGAAAGAIFGVVQGSVHTSPGALRARVLVILAAAVLVVVAALTWLPSRWP